MLTEHDEIFQNTIDSPEELIQRLKAKLNAESPDNSAQKEFLRQIFGLLKKYVPEDHWEEFMNDFIKSAANFVVSVWKETVKEKDDE